MMNPTHLQALVTDIRDCARRARELTEPHLASTLHEVADEIEKEAKRVERIERSSLPPALASNQEVRSQTSKYFQETQRILRGIRGIR